jgi:hypothetical protein
MTKSCHWSFVKEGIINHIAWIHGCIEVIGFVISKQARSFWLRLAALCSLWQSFFSSLIDNFTPFCPYSLMPAAKK